MADKDKVEKILEDYTDVFADICNILVFKKPFLKEELLKSGPTESVYKAEAGKLAAQIRDKSMLYGDGVLTIATFGIENQSTIETYMPVRIMGYDFASYQGQISHKEKLSPVITIVLNFSFDRWNRPRNLHGLMEIPEEMKAHVQDYSIEVFDIAYLEDEVIDQFTSDFKVVARFFKMKRLYPDAYILDDDITEIKHVEAVLDMLRVFTGDSKYAELYTDELEAQVRKGEAITMCSIADAYIRKGRLEGKLEGKTEGKQEVIFELVQEGDLTLQRAADKLGLSVEEVTARMAESGYQIPIFC